MIHELKILTHGALFIVGGFAAHLFHVWNRDRLNHRHDESHFLTDILLGGVGTLIIFMGIFVYW